MAKKQPLVVEVKSNGATIGVIETADFRAYAEKAGAPSGKFLPELIANFNAYKEKLGEPERVAIVLRRNVKPVS